MTMADLIRQKREEILSPAASRGAHNVRIFGSVARGKDEEQSDAGFLVGMEPDRVLLDMGGRQEFDESTLVHGYLGVDLGKVWGIVANDLPGPKRAVEAILGDA